MHNITGVIPAAGRGSRMKKDVNKQFLMLKGKPVLVHTLEIFESCPFVREVILVASSGEEDYCRRLIKEYGFSKIPRIMTGGEDRFHSVLNGLKGISPQSEIVAVHDGARPLLLRSDLEKIIKAVAADDAPDGAILAVPVKETIKEVDEEEIVQGTLDRSKLWMAQTPQVFPKEILQFAYRKALEDNFRGTDDASLVERAGMRVKIIPGSYENIKITTPEDIDLAALILERRGYR
ncbi:2-C-methyl-D-erythritol 4-phosphate cytidylyltransferase [Dehalobacterium formicoaceticum]|uniref:2-C-methyl-D-erythritol 4-phosphate cytidylyltransferase n=1 Tax=Dehalobacterium formicoaceticum TaxID=51515 RepID=A0ABT1Y2K1_9FIRM|nr:2-C-methyl-D-erythritol 4-phosphate cytidylyltransferase [Dehalobacterium formicoaceticum]MCR6543926.1 2-C-methyl-D-erythritol 4-phosphate cytidylyltransferase [Dehalobacterium formicoaceticum]